MASSKNPLARVLNKLMRSHSTSAFSSVRPERDCYEPETSLLLVFNSQQYEPIIKERIVNLWKALQFLSQTNANCLAKRNILKEPSTPGEELVEDVEELSPQVAVKQEDNGLRQLFEKMLELRMDKHALAIADGYRTRPQVCTCKEDCCSCFDYSKFLPNLQLHKRKSLLRKVYAKNIKEKQNSKQQITELSQVSTTTGLSKGFESREVANDEFSMKVEDHEEDSDDDEPIKTAVISRIRTEICSAVKQERQKEKSAKKLKYQKNAPSQKVKRRVWPSKRVDPEPPYETKFNSVHRRVREFDPDCYKILVREEIKQLNEMPALERKLRENRVRDPAARPPWKI